jgi:hypothetical protein
MAIAENGRKSQHNLSTGQKKFRKVNFLQGSRNWQKCSALPYGASGHLGHTERVIQKTFCPKKKTRRMATILI